MKQVILYSFYKNFVLTFCLFYFGFYTGFSGQVRRRFRLLWFGVGGWAGLGWVGCGGVMGWSLIGFGFWSGMGWFCVGWFGWFGWIWFGSVRFWFVSVCCIDHFISAVLVWLGRRV